MSVVDVDFDFVVIEDDNSDVDDYGVVAVSILMTKKGPKGKSIISAHFKTVV
jgi:hypothetical protein